MLPSFTYLLGTLAVLLRLTYSSPSCPPVSITPTGCSKSLPPKQTAGGSHTTVNITSSGHLRHYLITIPSTYASQDSTPVILSFHGGGQTAYDQMNISQMSNPEFNPSAIAVYPQGLKDKKGYTTWEGVPKVTANDTQFVTDIIDQLETLYCIDTQRIWATGKSDGGGMCNVLACHHDLSLRIAAIAPVSGAFYIHNVTEEACPMNNTVPITCNKAKSRAVPTFEFHGGMDIVIDYWGGRNNTYDGCLPSIPHFMDAWAVRDGLGETTVNQSLTDDTMLYIYGSGDEEGLVQHALDSNLGHLWPSTVPTSEYNWTAASFNATPMIVEWFGKHCLNGTELEGLAD